MGSDSDVLLPVTERDRDRMNYSAIGGERVGHCCERTIKCKPKCHPLLRPPLQMHPPLLWNTAALLGIPSLALPSLTTLTTLIIKEQTNKNKNIRGNIECKLKREHNQEYKRRIEVGCDNV